MIDAGQNELAAWQFELQYDPKNVTIVGIEGGNTEPFPPGKPPHYDPRGLRSGRIVVAAFTTKRTGRATGRIVVARLHLRIEGDWEPRLNAKLVAAARPGGKKINAAVAVRPAPKEEKNEG